MYRRLSIENPFSFCGSACEPRSRPASHDGPGPAARMAVKDARSLRAAQLSSAARSLTATAAEGTSTWAGATRFILGRSRPSKCFGRVHMSPPSITHLPFSEEFGLVSKVNREVTPPLDNPVSASRRPSSLCCLRKSLHGQAQWSLGRGSSAWAVKPTQLQPENPLAADSDARGSREC